MKYSNGSTYKGHFWDGHLHGFGVMNYENGSKYEGKWSQNKEFGLAKYYNSQENEYYQGEFINGRKEGKGKLVNKVGEVYDGTWYNGKMTSPKKPTSKISLRQFGILIQKFLKTKTVLEPDVKIIL